MDDGNTASVLYLGFGSGNHKLLIAFLESFGFCEKPTHESNSVDREEIIVCK